MEMQYLSLSSGKPRALYCRCVRPPLRNDDDDDAEDCNNENAYGQTVLVHALCSANTGASARAILACSVNTSCVYSALSHTA